MDEAPPFDLKDYRQPLVTSLGVILGFLIAFLAQWISEDEWETATVGDFASAQLVAAKNAMNTGIAKMMMSTTERV